MHFVDGSGSIDHLAFRATNPEELKKTLENRKVKYKENEVPGLGLLQIFAKDPHDITVEINYYD